MKFQAKTIQKILGIKKHRYEYIASKIGITPDVDEVEGQGRTHIYSFKNLMQFAIIHHASDLGLSPKAAKRILLFFDNRIGKNIAKAIFDPKIRTAFTLYYIKTENTQYYALGDSTGKSGHIEYWNGSNLVDFFNKIHKIESEIGFPDIVESEPWTTPDGSIVSADHGKLQPISNDFFGGSLRKILENAVGYVTINIGTIKDNIIKKLV